MCCLVKLRNLVHVHRCGLVPHPWFAHLMYMYVLYTILHNSNKKQLCCIYVPHWYVLAIGCNHVDVFSHSASRTTISLMPALSPLPKCSRQQSLSHIYGKPCSDSHVSLVAAQCMSLFPVLDGISWCMSLISLDSITLATYRQNEVYFQEA